MKNILTALLMVFACLLSGAAVSQSTHSKEIRSVAASEWNAFLQSYGSFAEDLEKMLDNPNDSRERHELYALLFSQIAAGYQMIFYADPQYPDLIPNFSHVNDILWGNPDTMYLATPMDPDGIYRLSGHRGSARMVDIQQGGGLFVTKGELDPVAGGMGKALESQQLDEFDIAGDGTFELVISQKKQSGYKGNWVALNPEVTYLFIRQVFYDWENEVDGRFAIERLDKAPGKPRPTAEELEANLKQLSVWTKNWVKLALAIGRGERNQGERNQFTPVKWGAAGLTSQRYVVSAFDLADDEALVIETELPEEVRYWNFQLVRNTWRAINPVEHRSSINGSQAYMDDDGKFRAVISSKDPGVPNWLDTGGYNNSLVYGRWNGASSAPIPKAIKVKFKDVRNHLPANTPEITVQARENSFRKLRRALQLRRRW